MLKNYDYGSLIKNPIIRSLSFFLPLVIITSGLKFYGYVFAFILFLPNIFYNKKRLISFLQSKGYIDKLVIFYFSYLIFQSLAGAYYIKDIRILIFWIPFFIVTFYCYFNNIYDFKNDIFYKKNILNIIFMSCIFYFLLYILLTIICTFIYKNPSSIQDNIWVGSSIAFFISSVFFLSIFRKWDEISFRFDLRYSLLIIIHNLFIAVHTSRLGFLNLLIFGIFILIKCISLKKVINGLLIVTMSFYSYSFFNSNVNNYLEGNMLPEINNIENSNNLLISNSSDKNRNIFVEFDKLINAVKRSFDVFDEDKLIRGDASRTVEFIIAKNHFDNLPFHEKLFGTGWYTTRITLNETRNNYIDQNSSRINKSGYESGLIKSNVTQTSGIVALLLDTGIVGIIMTIILYLINIKILFFSKLDFTFKIFYISMLFVNFFCLFIGYSLVSIPFFLFFLPNRLLKN